MVRIVHISDTHLGNRQYESDVRRQDFIDAFEAGVKRAIEHEVDAIIHTGDLFHRRTPPLPEVNQCIDILQQAAAEDIPFYGIVGNHDRKMDDQWLDLIEHTGTATRLGRSPTMVGDDVALYGIDAVPSPAWESADFSLDTPPNDDAYRLLCMHQLLHPPVPEIMADHPADAVIDRLDIEIDGLALGDYHEAVSEEVSGVDVWYAGSTERGSSSEEGQRSVTLLTVSEGEPPTRQQLPLTTRDFQPIEITFGEDEGYTHARDVIANYDVTDAVAVISLSGKRTSLTASDVHDIALDRGAAVARVNDNRGREHLDIGEAPSTEVEDPDSLIDQRLTDAGLSEPALAVEKLVRSEGTSTNSLADTAKDLITEAQDAAFAGDEPPETVLGDDTDENDVDTSEDDDKDMTADESDGDETYISEDEEPPPDSDPGDAGVPESESGSESVAKPQETTESAVSDDGNESASERDDTDGSSGGTATVQTSLADLAAVDEEDDSA